MHHAHGTFDVKVRPLAEDKADAGTLSRYALEKQYHGPLTAAGDGEMLAAGTAVEGAAGYVAVERVVGTLDGRAGSFILLHRGTMDTHGQRLEIEVLPQSGTGALVGIAGTLTIEVVDRVHHYDLAYELPVAP
jgi:hypothetical protein